MSSFSISRALSSLRGSRPRSSAISTREGINENFLHGRSNQRIQENSSAAAAASAPSSSTGKKKKKSIHNINASLIPLSERVGITPLHLHVSSRKSRRAPKRVLFNNYQTEVPFQKTNVSRVVANTDRNRVLRKNIRNQSVDRFTFLAPPSEEHPGGMVAAPIKKSSASSGRNRSSIRKIR